MSETEIDCLAKIIWDYMHMDDKPVRSDAAFCLCSHDTRVAIRAAELVKEGYGKLLIISGGSGKLTREIFKEPEAVVFSKIAMEHGVSPDQILLESKSTNTGENIRFTYDLLQTEGIELDSFILVQKPYMERRTYATFKKQWPDPNTKICMTLPQLSYEQYTSEGILKHDVINIMVGDLQRIREYPTRGFQIEQTIPKLVWEAYEALRDAGFDKHLIR